jgi:hypothetical protein
VQLGEDDKDKLLALLNQTFATAVSDELGVTMQLFADLVPWGEAAMGAVLYSLCNLAGTLLRHALPQERAWLRAIRLFGEQASRCGCPGTELLGELFTRGAHGDDKGFRDIYVPAAAQMFNAARREETQLDAIAEILSLAKHITQFVKEIVDKVSQAVEVVSPLARAEAQALQALPDTIGLAVRHSFAPTKWDGNPDHG